MDNYISNILLAILIIVNIIQTRNESIRYDEREHRNKKRKKRKESLKRWVKKFKTFLANILNINR